MTASTNPPAAPDEEGYVDLTRLVGYSGVSLSTLRRALTHPTHPLPHHRLGRRVLVSKREFNVWLRNGKERERDDSDPTDGSWVRRGLDR